MVNNLIDKRAAIDAICKHFNYDENDDFVYWNREHVLRVLRDLPSAQPEPQWIPVSEILPDKRQMVIIWLSIPKQPFEKRSMHMAMAWREPDARTGELHWMDRHFSKIMDEKVVAWMPLPEPYKEGDSDDQH